jgi:hypothetical protein
LRLNTLAYKHKKKYGSQVFHCWVKKIDSTKIIAVSF